MTELTDYRIYFRGYGIHLPDIHKKHIIEQVCEDYHKKLMEVGYLSPEQVEEIRRELRREQEDKVKEAKDFVRKQERVNKDTQWHDNIQKVKALIQTGKNPQYEKDNNLAHDHWHPELALLWEIAIEALKSKIKEGGDGD